MPFEPSEQSLCLGDRRGIFHAVVAEAVERHRPPYRSVLVAVPKLVHSGALFLGPLGTGGGLDDACK
jgi:hypothetical protein